MTADLRVTRVGPVMTVTFDRPAQHNAMTFAMYDALYAACDAADADDEVKVMVLRGAGGRAFASGTDITVFHDFHDGADGIAYEQRLSRVVNRLEEVAVPTVAAVEGYCLGGGLAIAAVCDLRVATRSAKFGMPIARTLGNCLSLNSISILVGRLGPARTLDMLLRARLFDGEEAHAAGFVAETCEVGALDEAITGVTEKLLAHAPLTMWATKVAVARIRRANLPSDDDLVGRVYGSDDFRRGVAAFGSIGSGGGPSWTGR
jgi:enoyl-CoA hydratase/carnithine racemase